MDKSADSTNIIGRLISEAYGNIFIRIPATVGAIYGVYTNKEKIIDVIRKLKLDKISIIVDGNFDIICAFMVASYFLCEIFFYIVSVIKRGGVSKYEFLEPFIDPGDEVARIQQFNQKILSNLAVNAALSADKLNSVIKKNPTYLYRIGLRRNLLGKILRTKENNYKCYFVMAGLKKESLRKIKNGGVLNGHMISQNMLSDAMSEASAIYIFGIYAEKGISQQIAISSLVCEIHRLLSEYPRIDDVLARPGTSYGAKLMDRFAFEVIEGSEIRRVSRAKALAFWLPYKKTLYRHTAMLSPTLT